MKTWDCFDTLIGRRYFHPVSIWEEVGKRIGDPDFVQKRKDAGRGAGHVYSKFYDNLPGIDPQIELDVEIDHAYPIVENMQQVKDGDIIISDMYLPTEQVEKMCRKAGLDKDVKFIVTPKGKKKGYIWDQVPKEEIELHTGDNIKTDYDSPISKNIPASLYTGCHLTPYESRFEKTNSNLAYWMRYVRLQCPYDDEFSKNLWIDQANLNLPLLALASLELPDKPIAFTYRDSAYWHPLYEKITGKTGRKFLSSRNAYLKKSIPFKNYVNKILQDDAVIVDLYGSGKRLYGFFDGNPPEVYYVACQTKWQGRLPKPIVNNMSGERGNISLEKMNCSFNEPLIDFDDNGPIFGDNDHPLNASKIHQEAMKVALESADWYPIEKDYKGFVQVVKDICLADNNFTAKNLTWAQKN